MTMLLVLKITAGILLAGVIGLVALGAMLGTAAQNTADSFESSGLASYSDTDRTISSSEYQSIRIGERSVKLIQQFGQPNSIVYGKELGHGEPDVYSWKMEDGGLLDRYMIDVDADTHRVIAKQRF